MLHIFIINPYAGDMTFANNLREKISKIPNLRYFIFNTRNVGYEREIVGKIQHFFPDEHLRFYCCGGSGTIRNMLNGFESFENVEIAYYPCGLTNDFLKVFGEEEKRFCELEELVYGEVVDIDYIKTNHGVALNTLSFGMDTDFNEKLKNWQILKAFGASVPYVLAMLHALVLTKPCDYVIQVGAEGDEKEQAITEFFFGNGFMLGGFLHFDDKADIRDGKGLCRYLRDRSGLGNIPIAKALMTSDQKKLAAYSQIETEFCERLTIRRKDGAPFGLSFDGEMVYDIISCEAEMVKQGLHMVVPKGVRL